MDISGLFFTQYDLVDEVTATISRTAMGDFVLQVTMTRKNFLGDLQCFDVYGQNDACCG